MNAFDTAKTLADDSKVESGTIRAMVRLLATVGFGAMIALFVG